MALPGEKEHVAYLQYVERWSLGEEPGPKLSKEEWRKARKKSKKAEEAGPSIFDFKNSDHR